MYNQITFLCSCEYIIPNVIENRKQQQRNSHLITFVYKSVKHVIKDQMLKKAVVDRWSSKAGWDT